MPDLTNYPTVADVQALLIGAGYLSNPPSETLQLLPWESWLNGAIVAWESATQFRPFLPPSPAVSTSRSLVLPRGRSVIDLGGGLIPTSAPGGLPISITTESGEVLTVGQDYRLSPSEAPQIGRPYTYIEFRRPLARIGAAEIDVGGRWGWGATLPSDAWNAIAQRAALEALDVVRAATEEQRVESVKQGDVETKFSTSITERSALPKSWASSWADAVGRYKNLTI